LFVAKAIYNEQRTTNDEQMNGFIEIERAESNPFDCAAFIAERIGSADGHGEAISAISSRLAARGELDLAAQLADAIQDPHTRDIALVEIAARCAEFNDDEYGVQLAGAIEEYGFQQQALSNIAVKQAERGAFEEALQSADSLDDPFTTQGEIALRFARRGEWEQAEEILSQIDLPTVRTQVLNELALIKINQNEDADEILSESLAETEQIEFVEERIQLQLEIAARRIQSTQNEQAFSILENVRQLAAELEGRFRDQILTQISGLYAHAGNFEQAEKVLPPIADKQQTALAHTAIALEHQAAGETEKAAQSLEEAYAVLKSQPEREIRDSRARFNLMATIAVRLAQFGKPERAIETALENPIDEMRSQALGQIAAVCAANGNDELAGQAVNSIHDLAARAAALVLVSDGEIKNGETEKSLQTLAEAHSLVEEVEQLPARVGVLNDIAVRFIERGERERAREVLRENLEVIRIILDETQQAISLANTAEIYEKFDLELADAEREILRMIVRKKL
jgi:tetratricopeptide (TPR) repeat protein